MKDNIEKRELKKEPTFKVELNEEQKEVIRKFYKYDINFIVGDFGSGKTLTAVYAALSAFRKKQINKIWITRPMLKNSLAALPGTLEEKLAPYVYPIVQNLEACQGKETTDKMRKEGAIEIIPIEVSKGITVGSKFSTPEIIIIDEFQDMDYLDFRTILTRVGKGSKAIFCGSKEQIDRHFLDKSCIKKVMELERSGLVGFTTLTANHRNEILTKIINYLEKPNA